MSISGDRDIIYDYKVGDIVMVNNTMVKLIDFYISSAGYKCSYCKALNGSVLSAIALKDIVYVLSEEEVMLELL